MLLSAFGLLLATNGQAQNVDDYRSASTGAWSTLSTWQRFDGANWVTPTTTPNLNNGVITIRSPHVVSVTADVSVDEVIIESSAQVTINSLITWRINNGVTGDDLTVNGTLSISGIINNGTTGGICQVGVNGIVINRNGANLNPANVEWTYNAGSTYRHRRNGSVIPKATWDPGSTCTIRGVTSQVPTGLDQTFGNFTWNCAAMGENLSFGEANMKVAGNLRINNTNSRLLSYDQNQLSIGGNLFIQDGATFRIAGNNNNTSVFDVTGGLTMSGGVLRVGRGAATGTLNIGQNVEITGGTLNLANSTATGSLFVGGNFSHTGGSITQVETGVASINFNGTGLQTYTGGGGLSGNIDFNVLSGSLLTFGDVDFVDLSGTTGDFTNFGTLMGNFPEPNPDANLEGIVLADGKALINEGTLAPGNSVGTMVIVGDFISYGTLSMEIEDLFIYDQIIVTGSATINGTVAPEFIAYTPTAGNTFDLIAAPTFITPPVPSLSITPGSISGNYNAPSGDLEITPVLPIHLLSFTGQRVDDAIELKWRTATEINNDYMAIERADHEFGFREIGRVAGVGTTTEPQDYYFVDESPLTGANYYRLRQVDIDGSVEYHPVIYVDYIETSHATLLQVFPNPAQDQIRAAWKAGNDQAATIRLFNASGQLLQTYRINGENGTHELPVDKLTPGVYYLQLNQGAASEQIRFVKQ